MIRAARHSVSGMTRKLHAQQAIYSILASRRWILRPTLMSQKTKQPVLSRLYSNHTIERQIRLCRGLLRTDLAFDFMFARLSCPFLTIWIDVRIGAWSCQIGKASILPLAFPRRDNRCVTAFKTNSVTCKIPVSGQVLASIDCKTSDLRRINIFALIFVTSSCISPVHLILLKNVRIQKLISHQGWPLMFPYQNQKIFLREAGRVLLLHAFLLRWSWPLRNDVTTHSFCFFALYIKSQKWKQRADTKTMMAASRWDCQTASDSRIHIHIY